MGFDLSCVLTLDSAVFALFDTVIPGGSGHALRTRGPGLPEGWVLPDPWELEDGVDGRLAVDSFALEPADPSAWRVAAGVPSDSDPLEAFDELDFRLGSFLSLAEPVLLISDSTFGGVLGHEHAALFVGGELIAAYGVNFLAETAFELAAGAFHSVPPGSVAPVVQCAEVMDGRFRGRSLFRGYLPREAHRVGGPCREPGPSVPPPIASAWRRHFPVLAH